MSNPRDQIFRVKGSSARTGLREDTASDLSVAYAVVGVLFDLLRDEADGVVTIHDELTGAVIASWKRGVAGRWEPVR